MKGSFLLAWGALAFMGCTALIVRALEASDGWYTGPAAAWVQALGSIAAVAGTGWAALHQSREALEREERERRAAGARRDEADRAKLLAASRMVSMFRVKADVLVARLHEEVDAIDSSSVSEPMRAGFRSFLRRLQEFPLYDLKPEAVVVFALAVETADLIVVFLDETADLCGRHPKLDHRVLVDRMPDLETLAKQLAPSDNWLRDRAEPGWREHVKPG